MKYIFASILITCMAIVSCKFTPRTVKADPDRYIIYLPKTNVEASAVANMEVATKVFEKKIIRQLKYFNGFVARLNPEEVTYVKTELKLKISKDNVVSLNPNTPPEEEKVQSCQDTTLPPPPPPPPTQPAQVIPWGVQALNAPAAWKYNRGAGVVVCITDTGIDSKHPDLAGQVIGGEDFTGSGTWEDGHDHGTHVAGTIAALDNAIGVVGVAPDAKLLSSKVLDHEGRGYDSWVAEGIIYCADAKAKFISTSLGGSGASDAIHDAVIYAKSKGTLMIAAAGNESTQTGFPAGFPEAVSVSAMTQDKKLASFSNFGKVEFIAPGVGVLSTTRGGNYKTFSGTSMATPHVSGFFALMFAAQKTVPKTVDLGLVKEHQGMGLPDALLTVTQ